MVICDERIEPHFHAVRHVDVTWIVVKLPWWPLMYQMKRNSFRAVFERTWTKISQMVMTTDLPCSGNMDQNQFKSDAPFVGTNKSPTSAGSSRSERQFTRVLRSKSSTAAKNTDSNSEIQKEQLQPSACIPLTKSPEPEIVNDGSNHKTDAFAQVTHLRQLLLLHLELIQQQQEELQKKDRDINQLKLDKEQVGLYFQRFISLGLCVLVSYFFALHETPKCINLVLERSAAAMKIQTWRSL